MSMKPLSQVLNFEKKAWKKIPRSYSGRDRKRHNAEGGLNFLVFIKSWPNIVGERLAKRTIPLKNQNKVLTILTDHPAISQQLSFMEEQLKKIIFKEFPSTENSIKGFKFIVNPKFFKEKKESLKNLTKSEEKQEPKFHPHSPQYKALKREADSLFEDIEDEEMKDSFFSLFLQNREKN